MAHPIPIPEREAQAKREIGHTDLRPAGAWTLIAGLAVLFLLGTVAQLFLKTKVLREFSRIPEPAVRAWNRDAEGTRLFRANRALLTAMENWEDDLEDDAWFRPALLDTLQPLLWRLGSGNGQAVRGRGDWMLFQPDIDHVTGPAFDVQAPLAAIRDLSEQLAERGITLVVVPAPVKPQIHPESLSARPLSPPLRNPSEQPFLEALESEGIPAVDLAAHARELPYLKTDTHWTPEGMSAAARLTAERLQDLGILSARDPVPYDIIESDITHFGDIAEMLSFPEGQTLIAPETVRHQRVEQNAAPERVLLLGDSFSNIFSLEGMGWGAGGGLAEHLGAALGEPVRALRRNDAGASATRKMLAQDLARGTNRLDGIEIVVWQFAARELSFGDWSLIQLPEAARERPAPSETPDDAPLIDGFEPFTGTARIAEISSFPRPGQVPYADHVITLHLTNLQSADGAVTGGQTVARVLSMRNHTLTDAARLRPGMVISLNLIPFMDVEDEFGGLNVSVLDNPDLLLVEPFWIESYQP
ncbi:MAG: hypothetical protein JJU05_13270 [Verrucomicrobia bacterium]|nr:hypothetical protein [Verrucomicrobiota bacterium]MCH8527951.1 hypothetical protein [Kiritimatiellia bacterium]